MNAPTESFLLETASAVRATVQHAEAVARLCAALDAAFETCGPAGAPTDPARCAAFASAVRAALALAQAEVALVTPAQREGSAHAYQRHLIAADPSGRYAVASLVWQPGHASPIHAHQTWCGYTVLEGTLTETLYRWDEARGGAEMVRVHPRAEGAISFGGRGRTNIHRLSNCSDAPCVSLHVYGVSEERITTHVNDVLPLLA
jgi:predicted metal-dependent enzyme (double-stranded beta helix superfamily)